MTLSKQLCAWLLLLFVLLFSTTYLLNVTITRLYLQEQLMGNAQNTANSLALSIQTYALNRDMASIETTINSIFDGGYYQQIRFNDTNGQLLYLRDQSVKVRAVPAWFIRAVQLQAPEAKAQVMAGWRQAGTITVQSHPGFVYAELWQLAKAFLAWYSLFALTALILAVLILRRVLSPLKGVRAQALAISERHFLVQATLPKTKDLADIVSAMNQLSEKIRATFEEQALLVEKLRNQAIKDDVTQLANRRFFEEQLTHILENPQEYAAPALWFIALQDFKGYNDTAGFAAGDDLLRELAQQLRHQFPGEGAQIHTMARLNGSTFALLSIGMLSDARQKSLQALMAKIKTSLTPKNVSFNAAIVELDSCHSVSEALSFADLSLKQAVAQGPDTYHLHEPPLEAEIIHQPQTWRELIQTALAEQAIALYHQPICAVADTGTNLYREIFIRIRDEQGDWVPAAQFIPMAESRGLAGALDKTAIPQLLNRVMAIDHSQKFAVNLSALSLTDPKFLPWLTQQLRAAPHKAKNFGVEIGEYTLQHNFDAALQLKMLLKSLGGFFCVDQFGRGLSNFAYLKALQPDFIKIGGNYTQDLAQDQAKQFFLHALTNVAHSLDIQVIAASIETETDANTAKSLGVDALQGYWLAKPERI